MNGQTLFEEFSKRIRSDVDLQLATNIFLALFKDVDPETLWKLLVVAAATGAAVASKQSVRNTS